MKNSIYFFIVSLVFVSSCFSSDSSKRNKKQDSGSGQATNKTNLKKAAVLELFTSQGCSSCPVADKLMGDYESKENVIVLTYHVDYWDRLGWKDPFSSKQYTQRQYNYASALKADVYTPQLIINGQNEMIGSDKNKISSTLKSVLAHEPDAGLFIKNANTANGKVNISFLASGNTANCVLNIAVVEKKTITEIKAGENDGATLENYNVVREFETVNGVNKGENVSTIELPAVNDLKGMSVILFLQQKDNNKISGAAMVDL